MAFGRRGRAENQEIVKAGAIDKRRIDVDRYGDNPVEVIGHLLFLLYFGFGKVADAFFCQFL